MTFFYNGCRIDQIIDLSPSGDAVHPTRVTFKGGESSDIPGEWKENAESIDRMLNANLREEIVVKISEVPIGFEDVLSGKRRRLRVSEIEFLKTVLGR